MIDTVVLTLNQSTFEIYNHDAFEPSTKGLYDNSYGLGSRNYLTCKQNLSSTELKNGIYKPRLTVTKRFNNRSYEVMMKIEFSAPKLIFKNNFDELEENDFEKVTTTLHQQLNEMGVFVYGAVLRNALVSSIHYSKNIALTNGLTPFSILKEIQKTNITRRLDFNQTDFRNEGHSIKFRTNSFEITFYDKMKDMQKANISEKRAIEKDNRIQINIFDDLIESQRNKPLEIIRMEIRLNQRRKIRQVLKSIHSTAEPTFRELFKKEISQKILFCYLDEIENNYPKSLYCDTNSSKDFVAKFIMDNPRVKLKDVILAYGFRTMLNELSIREIRELFNRTPIWTWNRFVKQIDRYNYSRNRASVFEPIRESIRNFIPLRTIDFKV